MLAVLKWRTLEDRRVRGDMIETYKILTGKCKVSLETWLCLANERDGVVSTISTLGFLNLVLPPVPESDLRKNFFSYWVVPLLNSFPDHIKRAKTTNGFKASYDSFTCY
jgi:hypothetical protein